MSSTGDKVKGMANEAVGNVKQGVGKATDNPKLQSRRQSSGKERRSSASRGQSQRCHQERHRQRLIRPLTMIRNGHPRMAVFVSA